MQVMCEQISKYRDCVIVSIYNFVHSTVSRVKHLTTSSFDAATFETHENYTLSVFLYVRLHLRNMYFRSMQYVTLA